jgi:hypothetical protein
MNVQAVGAFALKRSVVASGNDPDVRDGQVICLQNIGPAERRKRLMFGVMTLVAGLAIGSLLILTGANHWWRLVLFLPFTSGAIGFFQAREKT